MKRIFAIVLMLAVLLGTAACNQTKDNAAIDDAGAGGSSSSEPALDVASSSTEKNTEGGSEPSSESDSSSESRADTSDSQSSGTLSSPATALKTDPTKKSTTTTKKSTTTTKKSTTTTKKSNPSNPYVNPTLHNSSGVKVVGTWNVSNSKYSVKVEKLSLGPARNTTFSGSNAKTVTKKYNPVVNVAVITCKSGEYLKSASAQQLVGNSRGYVQDMAVKAGALVAVNHVNFNGGHWDNTTKATFGEKGPVVRNGKVVNSATASYTTLAVYKNGIWNMEEISGSNVNSKISAGLSFTSSIRYRIIWDGEKTGASESPVSNATMYGKISDTKYIMMVGEYMDIKDMATIAKDRYGVKYLVQVNGGNCSFMYVKGVGSVTGSKSAKVNKYDKVNMLERELLYNVGSITGMGEACYAIDIVYV